MEDEKTKRYIILKDMNNNNNSDDNDDNNNIKNDDKNHTDNNVVNRIDNYLPHIFYILIFNNITTRGTIVIYETQVSRILLDNYHLSIIDLGIIVSISGLIGTIQLIYFKELYTNNYRDIFLVISFSFIIAIAQLFIINWYKNIHIQL